MKKNVNVTWQNNMNFEAKIDNHKIILDAGTESGGNDLGVRPKPLMLIALGGCTGMDIVSILKKMKVEFDYFNVIVEGDLTEEHPKHFKSMKVIYEIRGNMIDLSKVEKAVQLSMDKYCGVSAIYRKALELTYEIKIL